jgi:hypothetical protein
MTIGASRENVHTSGSTAPAPRRPRALHAAPPATPLRNRAFRSPLSRRGRRVDPGNLLDRYRSLAISSDAAGAAIATLVALIIRYGTAWPLPYVGISLLVPLVWIALVALQRGYEARYLGAGPEE